MISGQNIYFMVFWFFVYQMVELKNGDTYNGKLVNCDSWMNINLQNVIRTSRVWLYPCTNNFDSHVIVCI